MRKNNRWIIVYLVSPLIATLLVLLKNPLLQKKISGNSWEDTANWALIGGTLYTYYFSIWSPYAEWLKMRRQNWSTLNESAEKIRQIYADRYDLSMNIMIPERKFFYFIEPLSENLNRTKFSWTGKVFKVVWNFGSNHVKRYLRFTINQGSCGHAYVEEEITVNDFSTQPSQNFNFTNKQIDATSSLTMLISYPIIAKVDEAYEQNIKILGVLNIESRTPGADKLLTVQADWDLLYKNITNLAATFIKLQFIK